MPLNMPVMLAEPMVFPTNSAVPVVTDTTLGVVDAKVDALVTSKRELSLKTAVSFACPRWYELPQWICCKDVIADAATGYE